MRTLHIGFQRSFLMLALTCTLGSCAFAAEPEAWTIVVSKANQADEAVRLAVEDLVNEAASRGLAFSIVSDEAPANGRAILLGDASRNAETARRVASGALTLQPLSDPEGYEIVTLGEGDSRVLVVSGGSVVGDVYGLYWLMDRLSVYGHIPDINTLRVPAMKVRLGAAWGRHGYGGTDKEQMRAALRQSMNWVSGQNALDLVPWDSEPEAGLNAQNREKARELINYAHALHMRYFSFTNEFTYHPSLLAQTGATLSPCDPRFWDAIQEKFRKLFTALPELDGVELCNDDISGFWDAYRPYDLLHENPECEWSYEKRFRTFVQKVHEVTVGEFGKTYFHFTWSLSPHEIHTQPAVFQEIFTDAVPTDGLYLIPKITTADRWWHQPYNPTFNLTPHKTLVLFETMNYYEGGPTKLFPTFSGQYFQGGLQTFLLPEHSNVEGVAALAGRVGDGCDTTGAYAYVLYRLMWDPYDSMEQIAEDFCAMHFGQEAAKDMARIYLLSPVAYKYGLHIEPISYGQFNSFLHMRVGTFPADGYPGIDRGKEHLEFLRKIYLRCKPWRAETLDDLYHGLDTAKEMRNIFDGVKPRLANTELAADMQNRLDMTRNLIRTNIGYVETIFAYFDYADADSPEHRDALAKALAQLQEARADFASTPGYGYDLFGVEVLQENAEALMQDRAAALAELAAIPSRAELEDTIAAQQARYLAVLDEQPGKAVKLAHVEVMVDGQDILELSENEHQVKHLRWDGPHLRECTHFAALPRERVTVIPRDIQSRPMHPFVLEQPGPENDYTARIYLDDLPGGNDWIIFDVYYIPETPESLGLAIPWKRE